MACPSLRPPYNYLSNMMRCTTKPLSVQFSSVSCLGDELLPNWSFSHISSAIHLLFLISSCCVWKCANREYSSFPYYNLHFMMIQVFWDVTLCDWARGKPLTKWHSVTSQETWIFSSTAVKKSNLALFISLCYVQICDTSNQTTFLNNWTLSILQ